ncbi:hypothetical protein [Paenibacillus xylaniclasticus]|uniref:hypothetical protein n=1 Tax=Paenibacillus xylaniclasticus TaxID=588083 RepID=UPI0017504B3C|nr:MULTISPECIES: hypothetical protein [Paenibacillus]GFN34028.1 hypothetical protein PCURB6_42880 [Paenibacillus curdlanolyticus]
MNKKATTSILALAMLLASAVPALAGSTGVADPLSSVTAQWSSPYISAVTMTGDVTAVSHNPDLKELKLYVTVHDGSKLIKSRTETGKSNYEVSIQADKKSGLLLQAAARSYYTNGDYSEAILATHTWP